MSRSLWLVLTAALLSSCAFYVTPEPTSVRVRPIPTRPPQEIVVSEPEVIVSDLAEITSFTPDRGAGAVYGLGEEISFTLQTSSGGYVTLTSYGPDGAASVFAQNMYVPAGSVTLPTPESGVRYTLAPPRGLQRVVASFSSSTSGAAVATAETTFYIQ